MQETLNIAIILHNPKGSTGLIGEKLRERGHNITIYCPIIGDHLPDAEDIDAAIFFGGRMSVNDSHKLPALNLEINWIRDFVNTGKPYLGICLGGQLLAQAFGGKVTKHQARVVEIGYYGIYATVEGFSTIFSGDSPEKFFQWHDEGFTIPENGIKLAASDLFPNQAFRIGDRAYGFQFHPEVTQSHLERWHGCFPDDLSHPGAQTSRAQWRDLETMTPRVSAWLDRFLDTWLQG